MVFQPGERNRRPHPRGQSPAASEALSEIANQSTQLARPEGATLAKEQGSGIGAAG